MPTANTTPTEAAESQGAPTGLQTAVAVFTMGIVGMVVTTALYGPKENSDRALRLIDRWKRNPEPASEEDTAPIRRRARRK
ncbi:hypothetical protein HCJ76_44455 [Streptomyces sp. MC1]|uniref:hypothetical protein n=1 Tax=Streptomyces sp. MC1 TaxID=295105 RepID=UPI0018CBADD4|nr:hypothetical protein [Streptomyces sp. MC1]MBG7704938.1 hypothetical protein [Streptomyces sp. MC1]